MLCSGSDGVDVYIDSIKVGGSLKYNVISTDAVSIEFEGFLVLDSVSRKMKINEVR